MDSCRFCKLQYKKGEILWEGKTLFSVYDTAPVSPGHLIILPKRHVVDFNELQQDEWIELQTGIAKTTEVTLQIDLIQVYKTIIEKQLSEESVWFCKQALAHSRINTQPDGYNHGINDGRVAGRTVDHLHYHIIPRFQGDMNDPRGGVRHVIPQMGNYQIAKK